MVLSDIDLNDDGSLQPPDGGGDLGTLFGREGNVLLVNGKVRPTLKARPGLRQRWRFINAAKSRYFQIALAGHTFTRIGGDGGLLTAPVTVAQPVLAPGERMDLLVVPDGEPGTELVVRWIAFDRGYGSTFNRPPEDLFAVQLEGAPRRDAAAARHPARDRAAADRRRHADRSLADVAEPTPFQLGINGVAFKDSEPLMADVGETQVWTVSEHDRLRPPLPPARLLLPGRLAAGPLEWKDTVNVPVDGTVSFAVRYDDRPGMWMFHCHILDHADAGMMGSLMVMEPRVTAARRAPPGARSRSTRPGSAPPRRARGSPSSSRRRRSRAATAPCAAAPAPAAGCRGARRPSWRRTIASSMSVAARRRALQQRVRAVLDRRDARLDLRLRVRMADLAGAADVQQRAPHPVIADLHRAFALVRHVAIRARDARARVDALAPDLELRVLRLEHLGAGLGVLPVEEAVAVGKLVGVVGAVRSARPSGPLFHGKNSVVFGPQ